MHDELWAGVHLKLTYAGFHLDRMWRSLHPPERTHENVVLESSGAIIDTGWQRAFYPDFDAFLTTTRSVPEIINACFGKDVVRPEMRDWFKRLDPTERDRRKAFTDEFDDALRAFRGLPLSKARNISIHGSGVPPIRIATTGFFGVTYTGGPVNPIPSTEARPVDDPAFAFLQRHHPIRPRWSDFFFDDQELHSVCKDYITRAQKVIDDAHALVEEIHGEASLTALPCINP